jgi:hypothetical protein
MAFLCARSAVRAKYGAYADVVLRAIDRLGDVVDVSHLAQDDVRGAIAKLPKNEPACLVGGSDVFPPFRRPNPTAKLSGDDDRDIPTDSPYAATPGTTAEEFAPTRALSRIPDGASADAASFLKILAFQAAGPSTPTPAGSFEEAAAEFEGALGFVRKSIPGTTAAPLLSPPEEITERTLPSRISGRGRVHILLHGADYDPDWAILWGHASKPANSPMLKALSARLIDLCDLRGSVVTFGSCYAAMLDSGQSHEPRTEDNQVSLACLGHGAKVVIGATRSNWINTQSPYDGLGPGLVAKVWSELAKGTAVAEALRLAKRAFVVDAMRGDSEDLPYVYKTVLQMQCYGRPDVKL